MRMRRRRAVIACLLLATSSGAIAYAALTSESSDVRESSTTTAEDRDEPREAPPAVDELPFPRGDPDGHGFGEGRLQIVEGSEVLSIIDRPYRGVTVVLQITDDLETVMDRYAIQFGCGPGSAFEYSGRICERESSRIARNGMAGSPSYELFAGEAVDGRSWLGLLSYGR